MVRNKMDLDGLANIARGGKNSTSKEERNSARDLESSEELKSVGENKDKILIVFTGSDISLDEKLNYISELGKAGASLSLVFSIMSEHILDTDRIVKRLNPKEVYLEEDIMELKDIAKNYDYIISPNITINSMSKLSQGLLDNLVTNLIWTFLYLGKEVYLDFESTLNYLGMDCQNNSIENMILNKIKEVKAMGATEIKSGNYGEKILKGKTNFYSDFKSGNRKPVRKNEVLRNMGKKKFYTEEDIKESELTGNSVVLPEGSKLTPSARDVIRSMGVSVKFE